MSPTHKYCLLSALLLAGAVTPTFSETILFLKNGDRLSGKVVSEDTNQVVFATSWSQLTVPIKQISKREQLPDKAPATNVPVVVSTNAPVVAHTNAPAVAPTDNAPAKPSTNAPAKPSTPAAPPKAPEGKPKAAPVVKAKTPKRWNVEIMAGADLQSNQKDYENYNGSFKFNYNGPSFRDIVSYNAYYGKTEKVVSMNKMDGSWRIEHDFSKDRKIYVFNSIGGGFDEVRKVDIDFQDSAGIGYKVIKTSTFTMNGELGANYEEQFFSDETRKDYLSARVAEDASWAVSKKITLAEKVEYYPRLTSLGDYVFRVEGSANLKLNESGSIFFNTSIIDVYDTRPAKSVVPNDFQLRSSVGVKF